MKRRRIPKKFSAHCKEDALPTITLAGTKLSNGVGNSVVDPVMGEATKKKKKIVAVQKEDAPCNNVGSGNISGTTAADLPGGQVKPRKSKDKLKRFRTSFLNYVDTSGRVGR